MAEIYRDMWGKPQVGDLSSDIRRAARDMEFQRGVNQVQEDFQSDMARHFKQQAAILGVAGLVGSVFAIRGVGRLVKDKAHRYRVQVKLHYPVAVVASAYILGLLADRVGRLVGAGWFDAHRMPVTLGLMALGAALGIVWTKIYIALRTEPKLAALERGEEPATIRSLFKKLGDARYARTVRALNRPTIRLTRDQALTGAVVTVSLPGGRLVRVRVPAGVADGQKLKIRSRDRRFEDAIATISLPKAR